MPNLTGLLAGLSGLPEGFQKQQEQQQQQLYRQFLMQQAQQRQAMEAQQFQQEQQGLGAAWGASGQLGGGGMGGQPQQPMPQQQPRPLPQVPNTTSAMGGGGGLPQLQSAILNIESGNRDYPPDSRTGAVGPGQIMPGTAAGYGVGGAALRDPTQNRQLSGRIVGDLYGKYGGNPLETAVGYNAGPGVADKFRAAGDNPSMLPKETQGYLQKLQPLIGEAKQVSTQVTQAVPPQQWGRSSVEDLHRAIEQSNPDASPQVKMIALMQLQKLMAPTEKAELQMWAMQNRAELQTAMQETVAQFKQGLKPDQGEKGWQFLQTPQGIVRASPGSGKVEPVDLPAGTTKMGTTSQGGAAPQTDPQKDTMAQGIANYQIAPLSGWALKTAWGKQTMENVLALNPKYSAPDYAARVSGTRAFTSGKQSDVIRSMDVAVSHLDTVDKLGEALANNDAVALNKLGNLLKTQTGAEGPVDFNFAKTIVVDEIVKATAGGVLTGQERQSLAKQLDAANSPEQLSGVISTAKALMAGQLGGLRRQFEGATGKGDEAFDKKLAPETQKALAGKSGGTGGEAPEVSEADYAKLPPGAPYRVPGKPDVFYKQ